MFRVNQKIILPESHGSKEGVITNIPKRILAQSGLKQKTDRVKVMYQDGYGGMTEAWFPLDKLSAWKAPKDITAELEAKHQAKMEAVNAEHDREKLDWIAPKDVEIDLSGEEIEKGNIKVDGELTVEDFNKTLGVIDSDESIEVKKDTDIIVEMAKVEAKVKATQVMPSKDTGNSDEYIG